MRAKFLHVPLQYVSARVGAGKYLLYVSFVVYLFVCCACVPLLLPLLIVKKIQIKVAARKKNTSNSSLLVSTCEH